MENNITKDTDRYFEEINGNETYSLQNHRTITESDIVNFAGISGDFHPYHMSKEKMASSDFEGRIAHGALVFSIVEAMIADMNPKSFTYGHDNIRFPEPVYIGDTLSATRVIETLEDYNDDYGKVEYNYEGTKETGETVLVDTHITLVEKK